MRYPTRPTILNPMRQLEQWHLAIGQRPFVALNAAERIAVLELRIKLITEEFREVRDELQAGIRQDGRLARLAKELADLLYVTYGTAEILGVPLDEVFSLVHRNNMTKVDPETGEARRRADGKILKPDGYCEIDYEAIDELILKP